MYQLGSVSGHASSLWQVEHTKIKWCAGFFSWEDAVRLRHVTTGRYLGITPAQASGATGPGHIDVVLLSAEESDDAATVFYMKQTKVSLGSKILTLMDSNLSSSCSRPHPSSKTGGSCFRLRFIAKNVCVRWHRSVCDLN